MTFKMRNLSSPGRGLLETPMMATLIALVLVTSPAVTRGDHDSIEARRKRLQTMGAAEKEELRLKKERFDRLSEEEKKRLKRLHEQICCDSDAKRLREIMVRYNEWLKSLPTNQRASLLSLPPDKRIAEIKKLVAEQDKQRFYELVKETLLPQDHEAMIRWFEQRVLSRLPAEQQDKITAIADPRRRRFEMFRLYRQHSGDSGQRLFNSDPLREEEIQELTEQLSEKARKALEKAENQQSRNSIVRDWIGAGFYSSFRYHVSDAELQQFLVERVDAKQREYLQNLPRESMLHELRRLYHMSRIQRAFGQPPRWPFRKRRPGDFKKGRSTED